jgi:hypothetical protein
MTREEFIAANPIDAVLQHRGVKLIGQGNNPKAKCPFHDDRNPSFSVDVAKGVWNCHAGCGGGSVIDLLAKYEGISPLDVLKKYTELPEYQKAGKTAPRRQSEQMPTVPDAKATIENVYQYHDELGGDVYQVVRMVPKTFRQRHIVDGKWVWKMEGVTRVLYRLPQVMNSGEVIVVEGEKDADNLSALGFCATCNVGGAGKWLDGYTEHLAGKKVVLCGDNDEPGKKHVQAVFDSLAGKAAEVRIVTIPSPHKDVSDWIAATPDAANTFRSLINCATPFVKGFKLPIYDLVEIEERYSKYAQNIETDGFHLGSWLPSFASSTRPIVPGELVMILGATGVGKTAILSNIANAARNLRILFFELELPEELLFERLVSMRSGFPCDKIEESYKSGQKNGPDVLGKMFKSLHICTESRLSVSDIEERINRAELKIGDRPQVVLIDYVGLIKGEGSSRYDRTSQIAEDLKVMAKATRTIVICASQISRKGSDDEPEVFLTDAKDSGSIENSSGLVLGAWRDVEEPETMHIKILKNTKGRSGFTVPCHYNGSTMRITQIGH